MNGLLLAGSTIVCFALIAYSIALITEQRKKMVTQTVLFYMLIGVLLDITATVLMISGSSNSPFTIHGFIGYSALAAMIIDAVLLWKIKISNGYDSLVPRNLHLYSRISYIWWIVAFLSGALIAATK